MKILTYPSEKLKYICGEVQAPFIGKEDLIKSIRRTMKDHNGIGLAAPQVGVCLRIIVFESQQHSSQQHRSTISMINPNVVWGKDLSREEEACLSIPGYSAQIERFNFIRVNYYDIRQHTYTTGSFEGQDARIIQHETDHLDGILYIDHLSGLKRSMFKHRYEKLLKYEKLKKY